MDKLILGCGYLGRRVAALWRAQGHRVLAVTRRPTSEIRDSDLEPIIADILDPASLQQLPRVDTVLYAIGYDRSAQTEMRDVYVTGLANVLEHLPPPAKFIYISSTSVYGQTDGGWVDETATTEPEERSGKIVLEAEAILRSRLPDAVILRFAGIYGPGRLLRRQTVERGETIVGSADKWLNLIYVDDGARIVLDAEGKATLGRVYNVADGWPVTRRDFFGELARALGVSAPNFAEPPERTDPPHEKANRRITNQRLMEELRPSLRYPDYVAGIRASLEAEHA